MPCSGRWLNERTQSQAARNVTFFNLIALHDGNRYVASRQIAPYKARLKTLLDQLDDFMTTLEQSGRKVAVVMVPEHGAALTGDKMQMAGLRDIPSPSITQVPVGVALLGTRRPTRRPATWTPQQLPGGIRTGLQAGGEGCVRERDHRLGCPAGRPAADPAVSGEPGLGGDRISGQVPHQAGAGGLGPLSPMRPEVTMRSERQSDMQTPSASRWRAR